MVVNVGPFHKDTHLDNINSVIVGFSWLWNPYRTIPDNTTINIIGWFIPANVLILLGYFIFQLRHSKVLVQAERRVSSFLEETWFIWFFNTGKFNSSSTTLLLPFWVFGATSFQSYVEYIESYKGNLPEHFLDFPSELFCNSLEHGSAQNTCILSQMYPSPWLMDFTIYDDGIWLIEKNRAAVDEDYILKSPYLADPKTFLQLYWLDASIAIICFMTPYSTTSRWWNGLFRLSKLLNERKGVLHVATWDKFFEFKIKKTLKHWEPLSASDIEVKTDSLIANLKGTYISFRFLY